MKLTALILGALLMVSSVAYGHSVNMVWFEFRDDGRYRVYFNYTVPALKELRQAYIDFNKRKKAEEFYWTLVRGGDFHMPATVHFHEVPKGPSPW